MSPVPPPVASGPSTNAPASFIDQLGFARNPDGGYGYYPNRKSRIEPTAWVALSPAMDAATARGWLVDAQGPDGWLRDDRRAPINYGFNAMALLAFLTDRHTLGNAERVGQALLQVKGLAYGPSPVVRQDNSLQAWSWVENTLSWVEPTAYGLLAIKRARALGLLESTARTAAARIDVAERLLRDRACASGGWNYSRWRRIRHHRRAALQHQSREQCVSLLGHVAGRHDDVHAADAVRGAGVLHAGRIRKGAPGAAARGAARRLNFSRGACAAALSALPRRAPANPRPAASPAAARPRMALRNSPRSPPMVPTSPSFSTARKSPPRTWTPPLPSAPAPAKASSASKTTARALNSATSASKSCPNRRARSASTKGE